VTYGSEGPVNYGSVETPIDYAIYLRGDGEGYPGAYMHVGIWESISEIVERLEPNTVLILENRIDGVLYRIFGE
jgi:hypothetical protein